MTRIRRLPLLLLAAAAVLGLAGPADAALSARTATALRIATATVAAPTDVAAQTTTCNWGRTQDVRVTWSASTSTRVSGYRVTVLDSAGVTVADAQFGRTTTAATVRVDRLAVDVTSLRSTVTTLTDSGWTAESAQTGTTRC